MNHGAKDHELQIIYHTNFGAPLLEKDARTVVAAEKVEPMNEHAARSIQTFFVDEPPTTRFIELVFLVHPKSDLTGKSHALLVNARGDRGDSVS